MVIKKLNNNKFGVNSYMIYDEVAKNTILIDPAINYSDIVSFIEDNQLSLDGIILTHGHIDHIADTVAVKEKYNVPVYIHELDNEMLLDEKKSLASSFGYNDLSFEADFLLKDKEILTFGPLKLNIMHTPGHTKGGICVTIENAVFTGDTLFAGSMGRTDLYGGNDEHIRNSLHKISTLGDDLTIYPGHGPASTIGEQKKTNPFMKML